MELSHHRVAEEGLAMFDEYYTPPELAQVLIDYVPHELNPKSVADFAAGEGALLTRAFEKWPNIRIVANDISSVAARKLTKLHPSWSVSCTDFLSERSSIRSKYSSKLGKVDLILINPPFSERGKKRLHSGCTKHDFMSGIAVAFLYRSLTYLSRSGCLLAVLPDSCFNSQRDEKAWSAIREKYSIEIVRSNHRATFFGVAASTSIVRIQAIKNRLALPKLTTKCDIGNDIAICRGWLQMHSLGRALGKGSAPLIHTTNLKDGRVIIDSVDSYVDKRTFTGPAVLFPRVGLVTPKKVCVLSTSRAVVLSDCVLAIACPTLKAAIQLQSTIILYWEIFAGGYGGTGAPYITIDRAKKAVGLCLIEQRIRNEKRNENKLIHKSNKLQPQQRCSCDDFVTNWQSQTVPYVVEKSQRKSRSGLRLVD